MQLMLGEEGPCLSPDPADSLPQRAPGVHPSAGPGGASHVSRSLRLIQCVMRGGKRRGKKIKTLTVNKGKIKSKRGRPGGAGRRPTALTHGPMGWDLPTLHCSIRAPRSRSPCGGFCKNQIKSINTFRQIFQKVLFDLKFLSPS